MADLRNSPLLLALFLLGCPRAFTPPEPVPAPPRVTPPVEREPEPAADPRAPVLDCPPKTTQVRVPILDGAQVYCRDRAGVTAGPYRRVDKDGNTLVARTFRAGNFEGEVEVYEQGALRLRGRDQADHLHDFDYLGEGPAGPAVDRFLRGELERAAVCAPGDTCVLVPGVCPFGCDLAVNAKHEDRVKRWLSSYRGACEYKCAPPTGKVACIDGACELNAH